MFGLIPWRRERAGEVIPAEEYPFRLLHREFGEMFDRLMGGWPLLPMSRENLPKVTGLDVEETDKEVVVRAELPGFELKEIEVNLNATLLAIKAAHEEAPAKKSEKAARRDSVRVHRTVTLPADVDTEKVEATYRNGVLEVRLPKLAEAAVRKVEVKT